jgi:hypothetical protein
MLRTSLIQIWTYTAIGVIATLAACSNRQSGYEIKSSGIDVVSGNSGVVEVLCPTGKRAWGGGFQIGGGVLIGGPDVAVYESSPRVTSGTDGWRLEAANRGPKTRRFDVWVVCAKI